MTPAIEAAKKAGIKHTVHEYAHDPGSPSYAAEAAQKLAVPEAQVFKTLVVELDGQTPAVAQRSTGYVLGGVSPLGQKKPLKTVIDASAGQFSSIYVSAGRRGLEIQLSPGDLQLLTRASLAPITQ